MKSSEAWFQTTKTCLRDSRSDVIGIGNLAAPVWRATQAGIVSGAVLVERVRTFGGRLPDLSYHLERLAVGANLLGWSANAVQETFVELVNRAYRENKVEEVTASSTATPSSIPDLSIVFLVMPSEGDGWLAFAHLVEIPWERLHRWYTEGVFLRLFPKSVRPIGMIPNRLKHRSRIGYWYADRLANQQYPGSFALTMTDAGHVSDTSFANLVLVNSAGEWISPSEEDCHLGVTIRRTEVLMQRIQKTLILKHVTTEDLRSAREVFLLGSTGLACPVRRIATGEQAPSSVTSTADWQIPAEWSQELPPSWRVVNSLWEKSVGIDVVAQAERISFTAGPLNG